MKTVLTLKDVVKYAIYVGVIYALMKLIPSQQMNEKDLILVVIVISVGFIFLDSYSNKENFANMNDPDIKKLFDLDLDIDLSSSKNVNAVIKETPKDVYKNIVQEASKAESKMMTTQQNNNIQNNTSMGSIISKQNMQTPPVKSTQSVQNEPVVSESDPIMKILSSNSQRNRFQDSQQVAPANDDNTKLAGCGVEMEKLKRKVEEDMSQLQNKIRTLENQPTDQYTTKYMNFLVGDLQERGVLDSTDVDNINSKVQSKVITVAEAISGLEKLKLNAKNAPKKSVNGELDNNKYSELPSDFYRPLGDPALSKWNNEFAILNTDKWQVPMPRPPVCVNTTPCAVCPSADTGAGYPVNLTDWQNSTKVTNIEINKDWANDQVDPNESRKLATNNSAPK